MHKKQKIFATKKEINSSFRGIVATVDSKPFEGHARKVVLEETNGTGKYKTLLDFNVVYNTTVVALINMIEDIMKGSFYKSTKVPEIAIVTSEVML